MTQPRTVRALTPPAPTTSFRILDGSDAADVRSWIDVWAAWPRRDVLAHPHYVGLFKRPGDRVLCAAMTTERGGILHPFIQRRLADEPWAQGFRGCDLTSAYGYAGPFAWGASAAEGEDFWTHFDAWAEGEGAVTAFGRLGLFPEDQLPFRSETADRGLNIVCDLQLDDERLWDEYGHSVRKNVRRARRDGVAVEFDFSGARLDDFLKIYRSTMDRREALSQYYFPRSFFESIITRLPGQYVFVHAMCGGRVVSSEIVLLSATRGYFFLGGTLADAFQMRPNDLLKHESIRMCRDLGKHHLVLGGGYGTAEGLLRYKLKFAPRGGRPFRVATRTYDASTSAHLAEHRRLWEASQGRLWSPAPDFFPTYRSDAPRGTA